MYSSFHTDDNLFTIWLNSFKSLYYNKNPISLAAASKLFDIVYRLAKVADLTIDLFNPYKYYYSFCIL